MLFDSPLFERCSNSSPNISSISSPTYVKSSIHYFLSPFLHSYLHFLLESDSNMFVSGKIKEITNMRLLGDIVTAWRVSSQFLPVFFISDISRPPSFLQVLTFCTAGPEPSSTPFRESQPIGTSERTEILNYSL